MEDLKGGREAAEKHTQLFEMDLKKEENSTFPLFLD